MNYPVADVTAAVSLLDLAPTVLDLAGLAPCPQFEGEILRDRENHGAVQIFLNDGVATVHQNGSKFIDYDLTEDVGPHDQAAYNLVTDAGEEINLQANSPDNCPSTANSDQLDTDEDSFGDECDNCPLTANPEQLDTDGYGYGYDCDNCPLIANSGQLDAGDDGRGDGCEGLPSGC